MFIIYIDKDDDAILINSACNLQAALDSRVTLCYAIKVACYPEFSRSTNLESKLIKLFVFVNI